MREKLREWDHLADDQLQLHVLDNLQAKISATSAKKDEKGKVIEPGVPACVQSITREVVTVRNVKDHFHWVVENRKMDPNETKFKVYIDSGEGSLKVLASITEKHNDPEVMISSLEQPNNRLSGVNRVLLLAYVEDIEESHHNMRIILDLLKFSNVNFKICADLKVVNILLGISSHGS